MPISMISFKVVKTSETSPQMVIFKRMRPICSSKSAVERQFIIIGEALHRINRFDPVMYNHIPHAEKSSNSAIFCPWFDMCQTS